MICSSSSPESEKIHWMLTVFFSFVLLISSRHHSKNRNGKTYVGALVWYVYKDDNGKLNLLYYKNILTVMRYYSSIYPDNIM